MTTKEILQAIRRRLDDAAGKKNKDLWSDAELIDEYLNDECEYLARELSLHRESDLVGYLTLTAGTAGQVDSVAVSGVTITTGAVAYSSSLETTARLLAANINAHTPGASDPHYRSKYRGATVLIYAVPQTGYPAAGYTLTATTSGGLTATATDLPDLCRFVVSADQRYLQISERVIDITRFKPSGQTAPLGSYRKDEIDAASPGWEELESGTMEAFVPDFENNEIIVVPPPDAAELIEIECVRLPLVRLAAADLSIQPETPAKLHRALIYGVVGQALTKRDVEVRNEQSAEYWFAKRDMDVEDWRVEFVRRTPAPRTNIVPGGLL